MSSETCLPPAGPSPLRRNFSWALFGSVVYAGCQWAVLILFAKTLSREAVGVFALAASATAPIFLLSSVRLRNLLAAGVRSDGGFLDYAVARAVTAACAIAISAILAICLPLDPSSRLVVILVALAKGVDSMSDICHGQFQLMRRLRLAATGQTINGVTSVMLVAVSLLVAPSLVLACVAYLLGSLCALLLWDWPLAARSLARSDSPGLQPAHRAAASRIGRLIWQAAPLGVGTALGSIQSNVPKYFIAGHLGAAELAVFAALSYIPTVGGVVIQAIGQAVLPELASDYRGERSVYWRRLGRLTLAGCALGAAGLLTAIVAGRQILTMVYTTEYAGYHALLIWLMAAAAVAWASVFLGTGASARLRFGVQMTTSVVGALTLTAVSGPLVGRWGLAGGAIAMLVASGVQAAMYLTATIRDWRALRPVESGCPAVVSPC
jgi:O-antigen/teichoic acid export membrane protein